MSFPYHWLAGNEAMEKQMGTVMTGYIGTTIRAHSALNPKH